MWNAQNNFGSQKNWPDGSFCGSDDLTPGRNFIRDLHPGKNKIVVIGLVIAKQDVHSFQDKKNPGTDKYRLGFTIRDSAIDFINVNCWGSQLFITDMTKAFKINDIVEVRNALVQPKQHSEMEEKWKPWTPSEYQLTVSEPYSTVAAYSGWDLSEFNYIAHLPIKESSDFYTLEDINANGQALQQEHINLLVVVKQIGAVKDIITKKGRQIKRCELYLFDETCLAFTLVLWDNESIDFIQSFTPRDTVLFIADVKVTFDEFKKKMIATYDQKTIITVNPDTREAHQLYKYASSIIDIMDNIDQFGVGSTGDQIPDLKKIQDVYSVEQFKYRYQSVGEQLNTGQEYGIIFAYLTSFNIDSEDESRIITSRCTNCKQRVDFQIGCVNSDCSIGGQGIEDRVKTCFEINMSLSDHTGSLENCKLNSSAAENLLGAVPSEFTKWPRQRKTEMKHLFLLERCKVYFKTSLATTGRPRPIIWLLSVTVADPVEDASFLQ